MMADIRMLQEQNQQLQVELQRGDRRAQRDAQGDQRPRRRAGQRHAQGVRRSDAEGRSARAATCAWCARASPRPTCGSRSCRRRSRRCGCRFRSSRRRRRAAVDPAADPARRAADAAAPARQPTPPPPAPVGPGHVAAAAVRHGARRLHRRPVGSRASAGSTRTCATFPSSELAARRAVSTSANATTSDGKHQEAVAAYNQVITNYPRSDVGADWRTTSAAWRSSSCGQIDRARESYEARDEERFPTATPRGSPSRRSIGSIAQAQ